MRIVFMGTPDFAAVSLKALLNTGHRPAAVFTQPDKPKNRGKQLLPTPVKLAALEAELPVYQPLSLRRGEDAESSLALLKEINPDVIAVVAYGQILPPEVLNIPRLGCVNIHASLLPKYRGAAPIQFSLLNGDAETGVTSMLMAEGLDTGDVLLMKRTPIPENEIITELSSRLSVMGGELLVETLSALEAGIAPTPQDDELSSYAGKITKAMSYLDFTLPASVLHNRIRAITGTSFLNGKRFKFFRSSVVPNNSDAPAGTVIDSSSFIIACGVDSLRIDELQQDSGKRLKTADFLRGFHLNKGDIFTCPTE